MSPYLTTDYFTGEILIPSITGAGDVDTARAVELDYFITVYEAKYLKMLLGEDLYDELVAAVDAVVAPAVLADKWQDLLDQIFTEVNSIAFSPAAYYVYYKYQQYQLTVTLNSGEAKPVHENASVVSAKIKMVNAWNRMVELSEVIREWIVDDGTYDTYSVPSPDYLVETNQFGI